jgi:putative thioredoxin
MPLLDKLAREYDGKFILAKVNSDEQQQLAAQYGVRSLPTVKVFRNGKPVDEFMGAQPESAVRQVLDRHIERESDRLRLQAVKAFHAGDEDGARTLLQQAMEMDPANDRVKIDLAGVLVKQGDAVGAEEVLKSLPIDKQLSQEVKAMLSAVRFARTEADAPPVEELEQAIAADPANLKARDQLGVHHIQAGNYEAALQQFLEIMKRDRGFEDDLGRKRMVEVFGLLGNDHPLVKTWRGRMASILY